jgi:hypothetical protein
MHARRQQSRDAQADVAATDDQDPAAAETAGQGAEGGLV